jgi:hypothetical protein
MTPSLAPSPTALENYRAQGSAFGRYWRGRPRSKFEESLVKRIDSLIEEAAALAVDSDEVVAAFDVAAWEAWEASVTGTSLAGGGPSGAGPSGGLSKTGRGSKVPQDPLG